MATIDLGEGVYEIAEEYTAAVEKKQNAAFTQQFPAASQANISELEDISGPEALKQPISDDELSRRLHEYMKLEETEDRDTASQSNNSADTTAAAKAVAAVPASSSSASSPSAGAKTSFAQGLRGALTKHKSSNDTAKHMHPQPQPQQQAALPFSQKQTAFSGVVQERSTATTLHGREEDTKTPVQRSKGRRHQSRFKQQLHACIEDEDAGE